MAPHEQRPMQPPRRETSLRNFFRHGAATSYTCSCSRRSPARFRELAGHQDLRTQRYMHLGTAAIENAIRSLEIQRSANRLRQG